MAADEPVVLSLEAVHKQYESAGRDPVPVLKGITLTVKHGDSIAIVAASGSGKCTLLNILGSLDSPTRGSIRLDGQELADLPEQELASVRNKKIGFIFQSHHLLPQCSVLENVLVPTLAENGKAPAEAVERAKQLLERVGLGHRFTHRPAQLSGGECQRVSIARAMVKTPKIVLADEPTANLDAKNSHNILQTMEKLNQELRTTFIFATHDEKVIQYLRRKISLNDGQVVSDETITGK